MREPVGKPGYHRRGGNNEKPEPDPCADEWRQRGGGRVQARRQVSGKGVDDVAEQDRLDECRQRQHDIRQRQRYGEPRLRTEQAKHAQIGS